jgi:signal transduction histidine kinase
MNLQARLTLYFVLLAMVMMGFNSGVDLASDLNTQFAATLERAESLRTFASDMVGLSLNRQLTKPLRDSLRDPELETLLRDTMLASHAVLEISVVSPQNEILADTIPDQVGKFQPPYEDFRPIVTKTDWYDKWRALRESKYYQLQQPLGPQNGQPELYVRVIIDPTLIRNDIMPRLRENAYVSLLTLIGAVCVTFLFSTIAFRPLGRLRKQLDQVVSGEYVPEKIVAAKPPTDEVSIMASRITQLSMRLRGAQFEVSDLRGNIDRLLQDLEDAVFIFDRERRLVFASGSVEKFLGRQRGDLQSASIDEVFPPATTLGLLVAQASQTGRSLRNRRVPAPMIGELPPDIPFLLLSVDPLETIPGAVASGAGFLVRLRDPEAQRKLGRELQTADRLAALSRVSSGVAHEVKNPLNAILLHVEVARAKLARGDTEIGQQMDIISGEIMRLDRVVKTFLDFTRPVDLNLADAPLTDFVRDLVALARPQADAANIQIATHLETDGVEVRIDRDLLKQALLNVVVNAMQAMPAGGELRFASSAENDVAELQISDTGPGIPPELRDKIFRLYFTTKKEGSGIGLAMAFRIVQLHDGTIDFTSEPGKGTTFYIRLPIAV